MMLTLTLSDTFWNVWLTFPECADGLFLNQLNKKLSNASDIFIEVEDRMLVHYYRQ